MPTVPRYGQRRVRPEAIPGARLTAHETPISTGAGLAMEEARTAEAAAGVFRMVGSITADEYRGMVRQEQERADEVALLNAENRLTTWEHQRLNDPTTGAFAKEGRDAFGLPEQVLGEYEQMAAEIGETLQTDRQRRGFVALRLRRKRDLDLALRRHVFVQMGKYEEAEFTSFLENNRTTAISNALDPERINTALSASADAIEKYVARHGLGPERRDAMLDVERTAVHTGVIDRLLAQDRARAAEVYYEETKSQINGKAQAAIEKAINIGTVRQASQQKSDEIMRTTDTEAEALEKARAITDDEVRDETERRVKMRWAERKEQKRQDAEDRTIRAGNIIDATGSMDAIPPGDLALMTPQEKHALELYERGKQAGGESQTDWTVYYDLMESASLKPENFRGVNLMRFRHQLADVEFKQLVALQGAIRAGDREAADKDLSDFRTESQIINDSLRLIGIDPTNKDYETQLAYLHRTVGEMASALQRNTGKKASNEDIQGFVDTVVSQPVSIPGSWWNIFPGGAPFLDQSKSLVEIHLRDIPRADRKQIEAGLRENGYPVTDDLILATYLETQRQLQLKKKQQRP